MSAALRLCMVVVAASAASACVSGLKSNMPVPQLYILRAPALPATGAAADTRVPGQPAAAVAAAVTAKMPALEVLRPVAMPALDTDRIALLQPDHRLDYYAASRWAGAAPLLLQTLAIDVLRGSGRFRAVEPDGTPFIADELLRIELRHFEAEYVDEGPPTIHVTLVATLGKRSGRTLLGSEIADGSVKAQANSMGAVVEAFERATGEALTQLLAQWPED